uniref:Uncharacterized protein n=1 Tax=Candidatus Kentrum sp. LPFa TaxID=2126335 RepID=A0A450WKA0_9GAMM|nr:MAG: hypothetical protein BECKLPF1236B_GA0070989_111715 [Candidatus Kentron sp. LPFa]
MPNFLHGVETIRIPIGQRQVLLVKSAVSALVGAAPVGPVDTPVLVNSDTAAAQFGPRLPGFGIAAALDANFDQGRPHAGVVIVVNVLDPARHKTAVADESLAFDPATDRASLAHPGVANPVIKSEDGATTHALDVDYALDPVTGGATRMAGGGIARGATVKASYDYADPALVTAADIIGAVDASGKRTGLQALLDCYGLFGFFPKRIIAPTYCTLASVSTEMIALASRIRARAYIDAPLGLTFAEVLAGRGPGGAINFNTGSERARLCWPHVARRDPATGERLFEPLSQYVAGVGNAVDMAEGYWVSPSNHEIQGITGLERPVHAMINDPNSEANLLNEAGITTVFNNFGTGFLVWGNRTAAYPSRSDMETFENVLATHDIIDESIEYFSLQLIDGPVTEAGIDHVLEKVSALQRKLRADGALVNGKCWYSPDDNDPTELAAGHVTFRRDRLAPPPMERITYKVGVNLEYFQRIGQN